MFGVQKREKIEFFVYKEWSFSILEAWSLSFKDCSWLK